MAVKNSEAVPLYIHTVYRILREMRVEQQSMGSQFNYREFKRQMMDSGLSPAQLGPLQQRLDTLESFMPKQQIYFANKGKGKATGSETDEDDWTSKACEMTSLIPSLIVLAWSAHNHRPLMSLRNTRECLFAFQHMPELIRRAEHARGSGHCPGRGT